MAVELVFSHNSHTLPVIGELFTAIKADNVCARPPSGGLASPHAKGKTQVPVPAAEKEVEEVPCNSIHGNPPFCKKRDTDS
jgi:hypothetical protein